MSSVVQPGTVLLTSAALREHCEALMRALGVSAHDAQQTVDVFLQAELMGEQSHGLRLFLQVLSRLKAGGDRAATEIEVVMDRGAVALGTLGAPRPSYSSSAMERAIEKARSHGIGYVAVRNGNSFTSAKHYPLMAAGVGMIGCAFTNTSRKLMPPPGGSRPCWAITLWRMARPLVATAPSYSTWPARPLRSSALREPGNEAIPSGWAPICSNDTSDPAKASSRSALLPIRRIQGFRLGYGARDRHQRAGGGHFLRRRFEGLRSLRPANEYVVQPPRHRHHQRSNPGLEATMEQMIDTIKTSRLHGAGARSSSQASAPAQNCTVKSRHTPTEIDFRHPQRMGPGAGGWCPALGLRRSRPFQKSQARST